MNFRGSCFAILWDVWQQINVGSIHFVDIPTHQWRGHGGLGAIAPPHFYQDCARDFLKVDEKIDGRKGGSKYSEK